MSDIFLSYKSEDRVKAQKIAEAIEKKGYTVWWDRIIPPGRTFYEVIEEELDKAKCVVVLWSEKSIKAKWIITEASEGDKQGILVPILIEDVTPPLAFRMMQAAKLMDWDGISHHHEFDLLIQSVGRIMGRPAPMDSRDFEQKQKEQEEKVEKEKEEQEYLNREKEAKERLQEQKEEEERSKKEKEEQERLYREEEERKELEIKEKEAKERLQKQKEEEERAKKEKEEQERLYREEEERKELEIKEKEAKKRLQEQKEKETFINSISMKFTLILEGEFVMGSKEREFLDDLFYKEYPLHNVTIHKPFYLGIYPVTQREWKA
ncbi:MAG: TIR domain-containing protein, partial [Deltaproteobacteria bacterium]|nr:TIR domain-containing protein [Deltaproteobacteria bacterium]